MYSFRLMSEMLTPGKALRREEEVSEFTKIEGPWGETKIIQVGLDWRDES